MKILHIITSPPWMAETCAHNCMLWPVTCFSWLLNIKSILSTQNIIQTQTTACNIIEISSTDYRSNPRKFLNHILVWHLATQLYTHQAGINSKTICKAHKQTLRISPILILLLSDDAWVCRFSVVPFSKMLPTITNQTSYYPSSSNIALTR